MEISQSISAGVRPSRDWRIFFCSVFFVLGFSLVFSLIGVLLQSVLANVAYGTQKWLGRIGGVIIILFGIYLLGLIKIPFLEADHKLKMKKFGSVYTTSFLFGAAFAAGWTPCVGPVLGAVLTLAVTQPSTAFLLLVSYTLGLGIPFLIVGLFTNQAQDWITKSAGKLKILNRIFGVLLIGMGILVFTEQLSRVANLPVLSELLIGLDAAGPGADSSLNLGIAFLAGLISFLSPCVLPLIPAFLSYLASIVVKR